MWPDSEKLAVSRARPQARAEVWVSKRERASAQQPSPPPSLVRLFAPIGQSPSFVRCVACKQRVRGCDRAPCGGGGGERFARKIRVSVLRARATTQMAKNDCARVLDEAARCDSKSGECDGQLKRQRGPTRVDRATRPASAAATVREISTSFRAKNSD